MTVAVLVFWLGALLAIWALCRAAGRYDDRLEQARRAAAAEEARVWSTIYTSSGKVHVSRKVGTHG